MPDEDQAQVCAEFLLLAPDMIKNAMIWNTLYLELISLFVGMKWITLSLKVLHIFKVVYFSLLPSNTRWSKIGQELNTAKIQWWARGGEGSYHIVFLLLFMF